MKSRDKTTHYTYDTNGNLLKENSVIDPLTGASLEQGDTKFTYDMMGRLIEKNSPTTRTAYEYDVEGYLVGYERTSLTDSSFRAPTRNPSPVLELRFTYDPLGRRLTKSFVVRGSNHEIIEQYHHRYLYSGANIVAIYDNDTDELLATVLHEEDAIDSPLSIHIHPKDALTTEEQRHFDTLSEDEQFLFNQSRLKRYYYHRDHQNSIIALSDENAQIVEYYEYDIYGTITKSEKIAQTLNPYRYTGREYDTDDLYYYRARYYDPTIGRFITPDPIGFLSGDTNFYRYVGNDPVNFTDPSGLLQSGLPQTSVVDTISNTFDSFNKSVQNFFSPNPKSSSATLGGASNNTGSKVAGGDIKIEPKKYLYFVFYTSLGSINDEKFKNAAKKRYDTIVGEINKKKNAKNHLAFLVKANSKDAMTNYVRQKVEANGGKKKTFIVTFEATTELIQGNSLFDRIKRSIKVDTNAFKPTPYFTGKIDQSSIDAVNQNIMRNEAHNKLIMSPEHQKKVFKMVADDCDNASQWTSGVGAALIASKKYVPGGLKVITFGAGTILLAAGTVLGGTKHVFNYLADDFNKEELCVDIVLGKTVYCKNEFGEFVYDESFSKMAEYFYKK